MGGGTGKGTKEVDIQKDVALIMAWAELAHTYSKMPTRKKEYEEGIKEKLDGYTKEQLKEVTLKILARAAMTPQEKEERLRRVVQTLKERAKERTG
jgi:hypothetical protein